MPDQSESAEHIVEQLTLEEKAWIISGGGDFWHTRAIPRLGIPALTLHDGPHGLRQALPKSGQSALEVSIPATNYPSLSAVACSFDRDLVFELGQALGAEAKAAGVDVLLAPWRFESFFLSFPRIMGRCAKSGRFQFSAS